MKVTGLSNRAVVRMWQSCPASASHSMIVRRLCVTPAVGSLMQWLFTRRNRTHRAYRPGFVPSTQRKESPASKRSFRCLSNDHKHALAQQTQQLLQGPLKHVARRRPRRRAGAAGVRRRRQAEPRSCARPAERVWHRLVRHQQQRRADAGEPGIVGAVVTLNGSLHGHRRERVLLFSVADLGTLSRSSSRSRPARKPSPANVGADDTHRQRRRPRRSRQQRRDDRR